MGKTQGADDWTRGLFTHTSPESNFPGDKMARPRAGGGGNLAEVTMFGGCEIHAHSFISKAGRALGDDTLHQVIEVGVGKRQCGGERAAGLRRRGNG